MEVDDADGAGGKEDEDEDEDDEREQREQDKLSKKARFDAAYDSGELRNEARGKKAPDADADADLEGKSAEQKASYAEELRAELEMQSKVLRANFFLTCRLCTVKYTNKVHYLHDYDSGYQGKWSNPSLKRVSFLGIRSYLITGCVCLGK